LKLIRTSDHTCVADHLKFADGFFSRLRGLIGVRKFEFGSGLLFPRCNNIHMWMMSIPIDVVFLKVNNRKAPQEWMVLSVHRKLKPWKLLPVSNSKADDVLELPAGLVDSISLKSGEVLCIAS
jgi:uncharacterized membrane protein (UPF0127 family)